MNKRSFIRCLTAAGATLPLSLAGLAEHIARYEGAPAANAAASASSANAATPLTTQEEFWSTIRAAYRLKPDYINLENGYYNILPEQTLEAFIRHVREVNYEGAYYMRTVQYDRKKAVAARLAAIAGCSPDELIITRNTTESLDMIIGGYPWNPGDEAIMALQDYGAMLQMFRQVQRRHKIVCKTVNIPNDPKNDDEIIALYENAITSNTRLLMISHMVNITGQILPVRKIADMAHRHGVEVMADGAHSFAQIRHNVPDLGCDYYGASLHKWLSVPLGAGILYVKKDLTNKIWPLLAEAENVEGIARLNHTGTLPVHTDLAINDAIDFYQALGPERKEQRLRYLQQYWTTKVRNIPGVVVNTPADPARSCAIANVGIKGMPPAQLATTLLEKYKIYTVAIDLPQGNVQGCRITPNVFTTPEELDTLVKALKELAQKA
jgi:selenocysteine lyase/cysteine desulfurase